MVLELAKISPYLEVFLHYCCSYVIPFETEILELPQALQLQKQFCCIACLAARIIIFLNEPPGKLLMSQEFPKGGYVQTAAKAVKNIRLILYQLA